MTEKEAGLGTLNLLIALYSLERIFLEGTEARNFANSEGLSKIYSHRKREDNGLQVKANKKR